MDTPQIEDFLLWIGTIAAAFIAVVGAMAVFKKWILGDITKDIEKVNAQLHRNGGTSMRDAVDRIEEWQAFMSTDLRRVTDRLDNHIAFHLEDK